MKKNKLKRELLNMKSKIESRYEKHDKTRICQGDILKDFEYKEVYSESEFIDWDIPYIVVLTQDCDLESDHRNRNKMSLLDCDTGESADEEVTQDKFLQSILVCPAYPAKDLRKGIHLNGLDLTMESYNSDRWYPIKTNLNPRYHFLKKQLDMQIQDLVIDFKQYYTIPRNTIYRKYDDKYIGTLNELFRESLSQRFAFYLSRIGLPVID